MNYEILLKAAEFAASKHRDQRRKDPDASPYINHPIAVARLLVDVGGVDDVEVLAAALLHDTIEDTKTTAEELGAVFGEDILGLVQEVTDDKTLEKDLRKQLQIDHAPELTPRAALVKLGDKIANVTDIYSKPPASWDLERRKAYLDWAENVISNCPPVNEALEARFRSTLDKGRHILLEEENGSGAR